MKKADKIIYIVLVAILVGLGLFFIFNIRPQSVTDKAATQSITTASVPVLSTSSIQTTNQATNNIASSGVAVHSASSLTTYSSTASVISSAKPSTIKISLIVDSTTGTGPSTYVISVPPGASAYDAMVALASTSRAVTTNTPFSFEATYYSGLGYFISAINGVKNAGGTYWTLYINGKYSTVGASSYRLLANDQIEWQYEK